MADWLPASRFLQACFAGGVIESIFAVGDHSWDLSQELPVRGYASYEGCFVRHLYNLG